MTESIRSGEPPSSAPAAVQPDLETALRSVPNLSERDIQVLLEMCSAAVEFGADLQKQRAAPAAVQAQPEEQPIPMILFCPKCGKQHIDAPATSENEPHPHPGMWTNPPHKSHLCHGCGTVWRPADVPTTGVAAIGTKGKADNWAGSGTATTSAPTDLSADVECESWALRMPTREPYIRHLEKGVEGWRLECESARTALAHAEAEILTRAKYQDRDVWFWQGDGTDHPESMSNSMVVVIRAPDLRRAIAASSATDLDVAGAPKLDATLLESEAIEVMNTIKALADGDSLRDLPVEIRGRIDALLLMAATRRKGVQ